MLNQVTALRKLTKEDVIAFFTSHISCSERRRKMSCHVVSTCEGGAGVEGELEDGEKPEARMVTDITTFKSSLPLFPLAQPFVELESLVRTPPALP